MGLALKRQIICISLRDCWMRGSTPELWVMGCVDSTYHFVVTFSSTTILSVYTSTLSLSIGLFCCVVISSSDMFPMHASLV
jgi:hypothetical protein